ncbi:MAG TPA: 4-hydroxybenzoate octaprenyltransferase [Kiloniellales bacterium]|nr:4-hydroxybenzoate octaprenyltransferase [Kiloniellales bacterium]
MRKDHWLFRLAPAGARPYLELARLDRPIGTWLLLLPGWWALSLAPQVAALEGSPWPDWRLLLLFAVGAFVMRGAGCTFNDIVDRDFDGRVARTALRPLPSGRVSLNQALAFLAAQLLVGLGILLLLPPLAIWLGTASLALVFTYPFMKRITYWPQAFLGLTFNWGALLGWAAAAEDLHWRAVALYLGGLCWTLVYDTIYAHQDREDDALIGVKSTALRFGRATRPIITGFASLTLVGWAAAGWGLAWPFWIGLGAAALTIAWQIATLDIDDPVGCLVRFRANKWTGLLLFAGLLGAAALA